MKHLAKSIKPFIGAKDFDISSSFYKELGFEEIILSSKMSYFKISENHGFYLQNAYVKDWIDNSMIFLEVENIENHWEEVSTLELDKKFEHVRLSKIQYEEWGSEYFLHDPSGILWHIGSFKK